MPTDALPLTLLHLALAISLAALLVRRARAEPAIAAGLGMAPLIWPLSAWASGRVPIGWMSPLREGTTWNHAEVVAATAMRQGPAMERMWVGLLPIEADLGGLVAADLALGVVGLVVLAPSLARLAGSGWAAAALVLAAATSPTMVNAALSETGGPLTVWLLSLGGLPVATLLEPRWDGAEPPASPGQDPRWEGAARASSVRDRERASGSIETGSSPWGGAVDGPAAQTSTTPGSPRPLDAAGAGDRWLARLALGLLAGCVASERLEPSILPAAAAVLLGASDTLDGWAARALAPLRARWRWASAALVALALWRPVWVVDPVWLGQVAVLLTAAQPWSLSWAVLPVEAARHLGPAVVGLAVVGGWSALRRPFGHALITPAVLLLGALYRAEAHQPWLFAPQQASAWELVRYAPHLLVPGLVLAALGWRRLGLRPAWLGLLFIPPVPAAVRWLDPVEATHPGGLASMGAYVVDQDAQREVRALYTATVAWPACAILLRVRPWGPIGTQRGLVWAALVREEGSLRLLRRGAPADVGPAEAAALLFPGATCAAAWRGLDCDTTPDADCAVLDALPAHGEASWPSRPFVHPDHGVRWTETARMGWREIPGVAAPWVRAGE